MHLNKRPALASASTLPFKQGYRAGVACIVVCMDLDKPCSYFQRVPAVYCGRIDLVETADGA